MTRPAPARAATAVAAVAAAALSLAACGSSGSSKINAQSGSTSAAAPTAGSTAAAGQCSFTADGSSSTNKAGLPPATPTQTTGTATATLKTSAGTVVFTMDAAKTPCTVESFRWLAQHKYFDNTPCHRLTTASIFVLQCGDPTGTGTGGPGYTIPDENLDGATYPAGSVAMANTGQAHSGGSQFFLNYKDSPLPPSYTPFGTVTQGLDVLQKIGAAGVKGGGQDGAPATPVTIDSFTVTP